LILKNAEFVCSVDNISPLSDAEAIFGQRGAENTKSFVLLQNFQASASTKNVQWE